MKTAVTWSRLRRIRQVVQVLPFALYIYLLFGRLWCGWLHPLGTLLEWVRFRETRLFGKIGFLTRWRMVRNFVLLLVALLASSCAAPAPTETPAPTATPIPPTATSPPPTDVPKPATITVCATGCDFITIQAAIDDVDTTDGATIEVTDAIHTEAGIVVNKDVTIWGLGAEGTIVQGHETPGKAPERVFLVEEGATVILKGLTIRHGKPSLQEECGGGIANKGTLTLENCVVSDNTANDGAGICNSGALTLINSTISNNTADGIGPPGYECGSGGGIKSERGTLTLVNSTVSGNQARAGKTHSRGRGGGIHIGCSCTAVFTNSTISGNKAARDGGGVAIMGTLQLVNCTISGNRAAREGGGVWVRGTLDYENTIIANNTGQGGNCVIGGPGDYRGKGTIGTNSNNLVGDDTCSPDYSGDPMLGPLADNGGPVQTQALLPGSPAIDVIPVGECTVSTDQRGRSRPLGAACDIGAFELQTDETP